MLYLVYNIILTLAFAAAIPCVPLVLLSGSRYRSGLGERLGFYGPEITTPVHGSRPIWIHAASVGEVKSGGRLIAELRSRVPQSKIIFSTFTHTGHDVAQQLALADAVLFFPLDLAWIVRRALTTFDPSVVIFIETEIWPNFVYEAYRRGIPSLLLSGRISRRAFRKYAVFSAFFHKVLGCFTAFGMQTEEDLERVVALGAARSRAFLTGNLKRVAGNAQGSPEAGVGRRAGTRAGTRAKESYWLVVGSSHKGEEEILLDVFLSLRKRFPKLQMVLAPRHPQRFLEVEKLLAARGFQFEKKSQLNGQLYFEKEVMLLDTIGDLQDFYAAGDIAFVGGSLVDAGGHNVLEPARFGKPVLFGPYVTNFGSLAHEMKQRGAAIEVAGAGDLVREINELLADPEKRRSLGEKAYRFAAEDDGVLERSVALAGRYIQPKEIQSRTDGAFGRGL